MSRVREQSIEQYLVDRMQVLGFPCIKFIPTYRTGMPDRLVLLPNGKVHWIEMKTTDGRVSTMQMLRHKELKRLGHEVFVLYDREQVDAYAKKLQESL